MCLVQDYEKKLEALQEKVATLLPHPDAPEEEEEPEEEGSATHKPFSRLGGNTLSQIRLPEGWT